MNHSRDDHPWRWVIGSDFQNTSTIDIECLINNTNSTYIDDPSLCGNNWHRTDILLSNFSSSSGLCNLEASFICIETAHEHFGEWFSGRYRLYHPTQPYWISENAQNASWLAVNIVDTNIGSGLWRYFMFVIDAGTHSYIVHLVLLWIGSICANN